MCGGGRDERRIGKERKKRKREKKKEKKKKKEEKKKKRKKKTQNHKYEYPNHHQNKEVNFQALNHDEQSFYRVNNQFLREFFSLIQLHIFPNRLLREEGEG